MKFNDFAWNCCPHSEYDCTKHKYVWCELTNESCKKSSCPNLEEFHKENRVENLLSIIHANQKTVKKFQKKYGLRVDGIPGPEVKNKIQYLINKELLK